MDEHDAHIHKAHDQGFLLDNDNGDLVTFSLPNVPMLLRSSYRDLVTLISDAIRQAPWPLQPGGRCTLSIAEIDEWSTQRSTRIAQTPLQVSPSKGYDAHARDGQR